MARPLRSFLSVLFVLTIAAPLFAQEATVPPEIENAGRSAVGELNADNVYIRSGAGDNYYPTMKLNTGAQVTVVGVKFDWLKILPPEGSFCYIGKAYIDKGAGNVGTINRDDVNVRAGSALNAMKTTVQGRLNSGQQVKILGDQDEYYTIAPPADAYVYVKKDFVKFVKAMPGVAAKTQEAPAPSNGTAEGEHPIAQKEPTASTDNLIVPQQPAASQPTASDSATPTTTTPDDTRSIAAGGPTTQPAPAPTPAASATAESQFDKLEADYQTASGKPIEQQPVTELLGGYQKLIADPQLPESMRRVGDFRVQTLKARAEAREKFLAVQKAQEESKKRQVALKAEQQEIQQQIKKNDVQIFTAVGTLRTSSLQNGNTMLYRLTDPASGHTVCYIRAEDPAKIASLMGKFIGVKGALSTDPALSLKVIAPTEAVEVDPNQLFRGVAAQLVPPSLIPAAAPPAQQASASEK